MVDSKHKWKAWLYLLPALVLLGIFTIYPIINTIIIAFSDGYWMKGHNIGEVFPFGIQNFQEVIEYKGFTNALKNTMLLCLLTVPISTVLALLIAVALNSIGPLRRLLQTIYFLPYVTNSIAIGMVFAALFSQVGNLSAEPPLISSPGLINSFLGLFGVEPINWINVGSQTIENTASFENYVVMVFYIVWNALPFKILILLGGLQSVNKQYYDAAKVDGTSRARVLRKITVPLLSPMIAYVVITSFIGGFKEYTSIVGIFGEKMGPIRKYEFDTMVGYIYRSLEGTYPGAQGRASAAALLLFLIILAVTLINLQVSKKKVHY